MIEINHLTKKYGDHTAVDDLTLTIESGRIYGFLGPNGAGKSTTMNMITGYIGATSGEIKINGYDIFTQPEEAKKCVGYLPELPPLYTDMTVREYLMFTAELKKIKKAERKQAVAEVMEQARVTEYADRLIKNLSKGYRQRVGLAQAILGYPEVIILDEPTVGLDPQQIIEIRELIKELGKKHTVILSSHILSEVSEICNYVFIISKGRLVASDSTENLTQMMTGTQEIELIIKASEENIKSVLNNMEEVKEFNVTDGVESGTEKVVVQAKDAEDIREKLSKAFAEKLLPIFEMKEITKSLEDVFLELTGADEEQTKGNDSGKSLREPFVPDKKKTKEEER